MGLLNNLFGGNSISSGGVGNSQAANDSRAYDMRVGAGDDSTVNTTHTFIAGGTNTLVDPGAVRLAQGVAQGAMEYASALSMTALDGVKTSVHELRGTSEHALGLVKDAYSDARTGDASKTTLIVAAVAVLGLLLMFTAGRKKAA